MLVMKKKIKKSLKIVLKKNKINNLK